MDELLSRKDQGQDLPANSAYTSAGRVVTIAKNGMTNKVHEKGGRNHPLTEAQKQADREKRKTRARVEHVFGFMEQSMNLLFVRSIGIERADGFVGLVNLTYNLFRYEQVVCINQKMVRNWG